MSYFDYERIAKGYAVDRPIYHIEFMEVVKKELNITKMLAKGLDVGCGTGSSTIALKSLCENVVGIDESGYMILTARQNHRDIEFIKCRAEDFSLENFSIDIITAAGSMNWIDENIFLENAYKMLKKDGYFIAYDNAMINSMEGEPAFTIWWNDKYLRKFPKPFRKEEVWSDKQVENLGFQFEKQLRYPNKISMSCQQLVAYLITQTNVIAKVEEEGEDLDKIIRWFESTLQPFFNDEIKEIWCDGYFWILKKKA